jgi:hypothetical protein
LQAGDLEVWVGGGGVAGAEDDVLTRLLPAGAESVRDLPGAEDGDLHGCSSRKEDPFVDGQKAAHLAHREVEDRAAGAADRGEGNVARARMP